MRPGAFSRRCATFGALLREDVCLRLQEQVEVCNSMGPEGLELVPLVCDGVELGSVVSSLASALVDAGDAFVVEEGEMRLAAPLRGSDCGARTSAVATVVEELAGRGIVTGWRDELVAVVPTYDSAPAFLVERAACQPGPREPRFRVSST